MRSWFADQLRSSLRESRGFIRRELRPTSWSNLRRLEPIDRRFGLGRGTPIDRFYIERFLADNRLLVHGHVLEVGEARYTRTYGKDTVTQSSVLHAHPGNSRASLVGDLSKGLPGYEQSFDCLLLTQVLMCIFDLNAAVSTIHSLCRSGGAALVTLPGISQTSQYDAGRWGDYWRFTHMGARQLFADRFGDEHVQTRTFGNVLAATALLQGIAAEELTADELEADDPDYPVIIGVVARTSCD